MGSKILNSMGIKTSLTKNSIKIYGNPNHIVPKNILVSNFLKDHRVCMMSVVAALTFKTEGDWIIKDLRLYKNIFSLVFKNNKKIHVIYIIKPSKF